MQLSIFDEESRPLLQAPKGQLLKWVGNKQRFAPAIVQAFPRKFNSYFEPFLGSGAVLGTLAPKKGQASDVLAPLIGIWQWLQNDRQGLVDAYAERWHAAMAGDKVAIYLEIRARYNLSRDPADFLFLARTCYGGVIRFTKDSTMNTPCGPHRPIPPEVFDKRSQIWQQRVANVAFIHRDFETALDAAKEGDLVYCDPPYADSETTLYGAQAFSLTRLFAAILRCKDRGVFVALSIDGSKRSGTHLCNVPIPEGLFETEALIDVGRSMLRRFQMQGQTLESEVVADRLLCTWL